MVHIITGKINQGKTTRILSIFKEKGIGDGFVTPKMFEKGAFVGYRIDRLSSGESMPFIYVAGLEPTGWTEDIRFDKFSFSSRALNFAESIIDEMIRNGTTPIFIDEIGPVELAERGFCQAFRKIIVADRDLFVTIRESCVEDVIRKFNITNYEIIPMTEEK